MPADGQQRSPNDIDRYVAAQISQLRRGAGLTQTELAYEIHVSCLQLQKYERAIDRISAGRLAQIANALGLPIGDFYPNGRDTPHVAAPGPQDAFLADTQAQRLVRIWGRLDASVRAKLAALATQLAA